MGGDNADNRDDTRTKLATVGTQLGGLTRRHRELDGYVRGEMAEKLDKLVEKGMMHNGEIASLEAAARSWEQQREICRAHTEALTRLEEKVRGHGVAWDRIASLALALIQIIVTMILTQQLGAGP